MKTDQAKKRIKKTEEKEEKFLRFLIRDFYEMKILFKLINDAEKAKKEGNSKLVEELVKKILKKLRRGFFGSEERIERRMARNYKQMKEFVKEIETYLAKVYPSEVRGINALITEAETYNADLEKLGARGGDIEEKLKAAKKEPAELDEALNDLIKAFKDIQAFEEVINQLMHKTKHVLSEFEHLKYQKLPTVSMFDSGMSVISLGEGKLVVLNPNYLLGKHGAAGKEEVASKFFQLKTPMQLYRLIIKYVSPKLLTSDRAEVKEADAGVIVGQDSLINLEHAKEWGRLKQEEVRGNMMNMVETKKQIPFTKLLNIILVRFNPQYGKNVDKEFEERYNVSFNDYSVFSVLTAFPGRYAPPATDAAFWSRHALLKKI